jgi:hypothetical protein
MPPNITIYCLDQITDYYDFERLCSDLMTLSGYSAIEPLGGFSDKGRDAVHTDSKTGRVTLFAYSVREDWRAKLAEDASKIKRHGHHCDRLVFLTTARFSAGERDEAIADILATYGWELHLFGAERLRILLDVEHPQIKSKHPSVFPPDMLELAARRDASSGDHLFLSFAPQDYALAEWLTRRLMAEGYRVWCERFQALGGENYPENVDDAIKLRTFRVIALYSRASLKEPEVMRQRNLALSIARDRATDFLIPIDVDTVPATLLDRVTSSLVFILFRDSWATGLRQLLKKLESASCPRPLADGKLIAAETFMEKDVLTDRVELVVTNCLKVQRIPDSVHAFTAQMPIDDAEWEGLRLRWASRKISPTQYLSFHQPSQAAIDRHQFKPSGDFTWRDEATIQGIAVTDLISELIRRSLETKCIERGLYYCRQSGLRYFPPGLVKNNRLPYILPTGVRNSVGTGGQRKYWRQSGSSYYKYSLSPGFRVVQNLHDQFIVLVRLTIRLTDSSGNLFPKRTAVSRRKHLCKDWWNDDWLTRVVAVCQYLADGDEISIGNRPGEQVIISAAPLTMTAPVSINEAALGQLKETRAEFFERMAGDDDWAEDENE